MSNTKKVRMANVELLRIIAMLNVIVLHFLGVGGVLTGSTGPYFYIASAIYSFAIVSTNVYVLISGYFTVTSTFRTSRIFKILLEFVTYALGIYLVYCLVMHFALDIDTFSVRDLTRTYLFPVINEENWFVTSFVLIMLLSPFYNILIRALSRKQFSVLIIGITVLFSFVPTVVPFASWQLGQGNGYTFVWFTVLYFIAAYLRLYGLPKAWTKPKLIAAYIVTSLITFAAVILEHDHPGVLTEERNSYYFFFNYNSILVLIASLCIFALFLKFEINNEKLVKVINRIASYSFAVFLIHTHPAIADILWFQGVKTSLVVDTLRFIPVMIVSAIVIYALCSIIEQFRLIIFSPVLKSQKLQDFFNELDKKLGL